MSVKTVGFIGLGLIGGSIARTIRRVHPEYKLIACNRTRSTLVNALADGTLNTAVDDVDESFSGCDIIFLCMPVSVNIQYLEKLKDLIPSSCIITDVGSVKTSIHEAAASLGMEDRFIGGHPMAGSEKTGYANSTDRMLENVYYMITPAESSDPVKVDELKALVSDMGAIPVVLDYREHDRVTAVISHLPHVIAYTLVNLLRTSDDSEGLMRSLAAGGFRDITRIASSSADMWESICIENSGPILSAIDDYIRSLTETADAIRSKRRGDLHRSFEEAKEYRDSMPININGSIDPVCEIYVDLVDEAGAIATIATILASNSINIKNIGIIHNREFQEGVLRIEFYDQESLSKAAKLLKRHYHVIERDS